MRVRARLASTYASVCDERARSVEHVCASARLATPPDNTMYYLYLKWDCKRVRACVRACMCVLDAADARFDL